MRASQIAVAVLLPPLAVAMVAGLGRMFWINVLLTLVGVWLLGVLHALLVLTVAGRIEELEVGFPEPATATQLATDRFRRRHHHPTTDRQPSREPNPDIKPAPSWPAWHDPPATNGRKPS